MRYRALSSLRHSLSFLLLGVGCGEDAAAPIAARIAAVAGDNQEASVCALVSTAPSVRIDRAGIPQNGISVTFTVMGGGGAITGEHAVTDATGLAAVGSWTLGSDTGMNHLSATAENAGSVEFTAMGHAEQVLRNVIIFTTGQPGHTADVAIVRPDGSCQRQLTHDGGYAAPAISPDGKSIAVARTYKGLPAIYLMKADGSDLTKVIGDSDYNMAPAWSPNGDSLAFTHWTQGLPNPVARIFVVKVDGTGLRQVTPDASSYDDGARWSPDGTKIAFTKTFALCVINANGTGLTVLRPLANYPDWSPDGSRIAYSESSLSIDVVNADGSSPISILNSTTQIGNPTWSPDGRWLVYFKVVDPPPARPQLFILGADGSDEHHLLGDGTASVGWPRWSPS